MEKRETYLKQDSLKIIYAYQQINMLADRDTFEEWTINKKIPVEINGNYAKKLAIAKEKSQLKEAIVIGKCCVCQIPVAIGVMDPAFMMGSMGSEVGEYVTRLFEIATNQKLPVLLLCCSGGARIQEGMLSLMQMAKTATAVKRHNDAHLLYISVLTNPTMGGVTASFAMLADVIFAEKGAKIGFAGTHLVEQNVRESLPNNCQTAEYQMKYGFVDSVVSREELSEVVTEILKLHQRKKRNYTTRNRKYTCCKKVQSDKRKTIDSIKLVRSKERPTSKDFIDYLFTDFFEIHGDQLGGDDHAVIAGICNYHEMAVTVIGQQKGKKNLEEAIYRNWGMVSPAGYRKAYRAMKQAEKFNRPVICFIDSIGAACGKDAEEQGQAITIAKMLQGMSTLTVPILSIVLSEGASGGALALGVGNEVWMLENAIYSIVTPEGYASIRWKDNNKVQEAMDEMMLSASELYGQGIIDRIIPEYEHLTCKCMEDVCRCLDEEMNNFFAKYIKYSGKRLVNQRYKRFRKF